MEVKIISKFSLYSKLVACFKTTFLPNEFHFIDKLLFEFMALILSNIFNGSSSMLVGFKEKLESGINMQVIGLVYNTEVVPHSIAPKIILQVLSMTLLVCLRGATGYMN